MRKLWGGVALASTIAVAVTALNGFQLPDPGYSPQEPATARSSIKADENSEINYSPNNPFRMKQFGDPTYELELQKAIKDKSLSFTEKIATALVSIRPTAIWLGPWLPRGKVGTEVGRLQSLAESKNEIPVYVVYGMFGCMIDDPRSLRENDYGPWISEIANTLRGRKAVVILEPDALGLSDKCNKSLTFLSGSVDLFSQIDSVTTYVDAGHSKWLPANVVINKLRQVGAGKLRGFSLNVSNTQPVSELKTYGEEIGNALNRYYVIDTSRSGGSSLEYCNPTKDAFGYLPTPTKDGNLDALLWIKHPGESDGDCNGQMSGMPEPGVFVLESFKRTLNNSFKTGSINRYYQND